MATATTAPPLAQNTCPMCGKSFAQNRARNKKYCSARCRANSYWLSPTFKENRRAYLQSEKGRKSLLRFRKSEKAKDYRRRYERCEKCQLLREKYKKNGMKKIWEKRFRQTEEYRARAKQEQRKRRMFQDELNLLGALTKLENAP